MCYIAHQWFILTIWNLSFRIYFYIAPGRSQKITIIVFTFVTELKHTSWCLAQTLMYRSHKIMWEKNGLLCSFCVISIVWHQDQLTLISVPCENIEQVPDSSWQRAWVLFLYMVDVHTEPAITQYLIKQTIKIPHTYLFLICATLPNNEFEIFFLWVNFHDIEIPNHPGTFRQPCGMNMFILWWLDVD